MSTPEIVTFGCRLNTYESEIIRAQAAAAGLRDAVIFNTCAVTGEAERQARQAIRKARRSRPDARIVVTGCAAQLAPERYAGMAEVDLVLGNRAKLRRESYHPGSGPRVIVNDMTSAWETAGHLVSGFDGRARAFAQIQQGCDHRCTFCIIPLARGPSRSTPPEEAIAQLRALAANGYREIVLTGVDITDYGRDLSGGPTLGELVRRLLAAAPELPRLRLSSLDPAEIDDELFAAVADEPRLMPHFHLSIQAGDDLVLKRMKRRHRRADAIKFCDRVRKLRPDAVFGADLIAGFPTETEAMFASTLSLIDACGLTYLHVFPYSSRPGTPAARMPQLPVAERKARAAALREVGARRLHVFLDGRVGKTLRVLVEAGRRGRCEHYAPVTLDRDAPSGGIVAATGLRRVGDRLEARALR